MDEVRLVASLIVRNELGRYLAPCVESLLEFCDEVCVLDDGSEDGTYAWLANRPRVRVSAPRDPLFFTHEGRARQALLTWTLRHDPTHVLAVDADELVTDGPLIREALEARPDVDAWTVCMEEVWRARDDGLAVRIDGGWRPHPVPVLWRVPERTRGLRIADRQLACGREPEQVRRLPAGCIDASILHFGWANRAERQARYDRYAVADGGRFHASQHLRSILWPDARVRTIPRPWPTVLEPYRATILARASVSE